ncbi:MAG: hypothetical protein U9P70_04510 [Patescibacteria group bacterium]|nr:hypothetical protein [Patescibacteria group bacterium]
MEFGTPKNLSAVSEGNDSVETREEDFNQSIIEMAEKYFLKGDFKKAVLFLESAEDEFIETRIEELLNGDDSDRRLAEIMYQSTEWKDETKGTTENVKIKKSDEIRVVMPEEKYNDGKVLFLKPDEFAEFMKKRKENKLKIGIGEEGELIIEAKDPEVVLNKAEECFNGGDFESAYSKLMLIDEESKKKRMEELSSGSNEERDLKEKMYESTEWQDEIRNDTWEKKIKDRKANDKN